MYPIRIISIKDDGDLTLNQGGITITEGTILEVFNTGDIDYDTYSGESLGRDENWVATIKLSKVLPKKSIAFVTDGDNKKMILAGDSVE